MPRTGPGYREAPPGPNQPAKSHWACRFLQRIVSRDHPPRSVTGAPACLLADRARPAEPLPPSPPRPHPVRALARSGPSVSPGRAAKHLDRPMGRTRQAWYATTRRPACPDSISLAEPLVGGHTGRLHASDYPSPRGELQTEPDSTALARPGLSGL